MEKLLIIGTGAAARSLYLFVQQYNLFDVVGFAVNNIYKTCDTYCGLHVYAIENLEENINKDTDFIFVAMQWNKLNAERRKVYETLKAQGYKFADIIAPDAIVNGELHGGNHWICEGSIIGFGSVLSENVFVKIGAVVANNTYIGSHSFIGARSFIAAGVNVGEQSFIGVSSTVFDRVTIGKKCIVGGGTIVKRNLQDFSVIKTASESFVIKQYDEDVIESKLISKKNIR